VLAGEAIDDVEVAVAIGVPGHFALLGVSLESQSSVEPGAELSAGHGDSGAWGELQWRRRPTVGHGKAVPAQFEQVG